MLIFSKNSRNGSFLPKIKGKKVFFKCHKVFDFVLVFVSEVCMKKKGFTKALFFVLIFLVSIISCEIGLGSAVDTQPPSVSISYPPSLSVIRDSFVFAGNWNDDRTIEGVFVEVYQIKDDQKTIVYKEQAQTTDKIDTKEEKKDGTWSDRKSVV